jgi:hypothetical protein
MVRSFEKWRQGSWPRRFGTIRRFNSCVLLRLLVKWRNISLTRRGLGILLSDLGILIQLKSHRDIRRERGIEAFRRFFSNQILFYWVSIWSWSVSDILDFFDFFVYLFEFSWLHVGQPDSGWKSWEGLTTWGEPMG